MARTKPAPAIGVTDPARGCKFPLWGHFERYTPGKSLFCGEPRDGDGTSWCAEHRALCRGVAPVLTKAPSPSLSPPRRPNF